MRRRTLVAILVTAAVVGGLLILFPAEWVALLIALIALLSAQAVLILRHTRVVPSGGESAFRGRAPASVLGEQSVSPRPAQTAGAGQRPPQPAPPADAAAAPAESDALPSSEIFSRFRSHLETMERAAPVAAGASRAPAGAKSAPATTEGRAPATEAVADRVVLSAAVKQQANAATPASSRPAAPAQAPAAKAPAREAAPAAPAAQPSPSAQPPESAPVPAAAPARASSRPGAGKGAGAAPGRSATRDARAALKAAAEEEEGPDLFADLRPEIAVGRAGASERKPASAQKPATAPQDEVGAALERAREPQSIRDEGEALIRLAEEALNAGDAGRAQAVVGQYEALVAGAPELASWEAARAQLRLAAREGRTEALAPAFQAMLDRGYAPKEESVEGEIDALIDALPTENKAAAKVALLVKALAPFRQAGNRAALDRLYTRIEVVQDAAGDPRKLIQFYKNHLAIKEAMGDRKGQLGLIDHIGNRYFQLGDTAPAKEYYEMGMKLRLEMEQQRAHDAANQPEGGKAGPEV